MAELQTDERIAWAVLDMETTGLDANLDVPLELGIKLIDLTGFVLHEKAVLVYENLFMSTRYKEGIKRGQSNSFVNEMHTKSGLWNDLLDTENKVFTRDEADIEMVRWLVNCGAPAGLGMMGNSIGSLDRPFALRHFPKLDAYLGYRNIDMSTLKELAKKLNPELWENIAPIVSNKETADHRVLSDIDACILEYRTYGIEFLLTGDEVNF